MTPKHMRPPSGRSAVFWCLQHTPWFMALAIIAALVTAVPAFHRSFLWLRLSQQYFTVAALALAMTPIILTGGIDLSVGSVSVFASVVVGALWRDLGWSIGAAMLGGVIAATVAGMLNGLLIVAGVLPLVATLATRALFRGLALTIGGDRPVNHFPPGLGEAWRGTWASLPATLWVLGAFFVLTYIVVHHTWIGRMVYAVGDNEEAARFAGIPVRPLKLGLYVWSGVVAGVCGIALVMRYDSAKATAEPDLELLAITCVVLGGVRITGGFGQVGGTALGIITVCALLSGLGALHWLGQNWRSTALGALLISVAICNEACNRWVARRRGALAASYSAPASDDSQTSTPGVSL